MENSNEAVVVLIIAFASIGVLGGFFLTCMVVVDGRFLILNGDKYCDELIKRYKDGEAAGRRSALSESIRLEEGCHYMCDFEDGMYEGAMYCVGDDLLVFGHDHSYLAKDITCKPLYKLERAK